MKNNKKKVKFIKFRKINKLLSCLLLIVMVVGFLPFEMMNKVEANADITLADISLGSTIVDTNGRWKLPLEWTVIAHNHYGENETALISKEIIETMYNRTESYKGSSVYSFLESTFYNAVGRDFRDAIVKTKIESRYTGNGGFTGISTMNVNIWIPSARELGFNGDFKDGKDFEYFNSNDSRIAKFGSENIGYWTRTSTGKSQRLVPYGITEVGELSSYLNYRQQYGVRPVTNLRSDTVLQHISGNKYKIKQDINEWSLDKIHNLEETQKYGSWANGYYGKETLSSNYRLINANNSTPFGAIIDSDEQRIEQILPNGWVITIDNYGMINWHKDFESDQPTVINFDGRDIEKVELGHIQSIGLVPLLYTNDNFIHYINNEDNQVRMLPVFQDEIKGTMVYHKKSNEATHYLFIKNDGSLVYIDNNMMDHTTQINMNNVVQVIPSTHERPDYFLMKDGTLKTLEGEVDLPDDLTIKNVLSNRFAELSDENIYSMENTSLKNTNLLNFMVEEAVNNFLILKNGNIMTVSSDGSTSYLNDVNEKLVKSIVEVDENNTFILMLDNTTRSYGDIAELGDIVARGVDYTKIKGFLSNNTGKDMLLMVVETEDDFNQKYGSFYNYKGEYLREDNCFAVADLVVEEIQEKSDFDFDPEANVDDLIERIEGMIEDMASIDEAEGIQNLINKIPYSHREDKNRLQQMLIDKIAELMDVKDEKLEEVTKAVEKAEKTKTQEDVDSARDLVNALAKSQDKDNLNARLDKIQKEIDDKKTHDQAVKDIEDAIKDMIDPSEAEDIQKEIDDLKDGEDKAKVQKDLDNKVGELEKAGKDKALEEVTKAVEKAEETRTQEDVDSARDKVNKLPEGEDKDDLNDRLDAIQQEIDKKAHDDKVKDIEDAIESMTDPSEAEDIQKEIDDLKDGEDKAKVQKDLDNKVGELEKAGKDKALEEVTKAVEKAEETRTQKDVDNARDLVNKLPKGQDKNDLSARLDIIQAELDKLRIATEAVVRAEKTRTQNNVDSARKLVNTLPEGEDRDGLNRRLDAVQVAINKSDFENLIDGSQGGEDLKNAEEAIKDSDLSEEEKEELLNRLNKKAIELATNAVNIAEAIKRNPYISNAKGLVDKIKDCEEKTALEDRLNTIYDGLSDNSEMTLKNAERAVVQAETVKRGPVLDNAKLVVNGLKNSPEKDAFLERIKAIENHINDEKEKEEPKKPLNSESQIKRAEDAVRLAERFKRQAFINSAKQAVSKLNGSEEKTAFLERLNAI